MTVEDTKARVIEDIEQNNVRVNSNKLKDVDPYDFFIKMNLIINSHLAKDGGQVKLVDVVREFFDK